VTCEWKPQPYQSWNTTRIMPAAIDKKKNAKPMDLARSGQLSELL
jgi:hypothetical protein